MADTRSTTGSPDPYVLMSSLVFPVSGRENSLPVRSVLLLSCSLYSFHISATLRLPFFLCYPWSLLPTLTFPGSPLRRESSTVNSFFGLPPLPFGTSLESFLVRSVPPCRTRSRLHPDTNRTNSLTFLRSTDLGLLAPFSPPLFSFLYPPNLRGRR